MYCIVFIKNAESKPKIDKWNFQKIFQMNDKTRSLMEIARSTLKIFRRIRSL